MQHESSTSSNTLNTNLQPTISPNESRSSSPQQNGTEIHGSNQIDSLESIARSRVISQLDSIVESFRNEERSKVEALSKILGLINEQRGLSEFQKSQTFDQYADEINSIQNLSKVAGKRAERFIPVEKNGAKTSSDVVGIKNNGTKRAKSLSSEPETEPIDSSDQSDNGDFDYNTNKRPTKRPKLRESDMPWYGKKTDSNGEPIDPSCFKTGRLLRIYDRDIHQARTFSKNAATRPPGVPNAQWDKILRGEMVDLDSFFSRIHYVGLDEERTARLGDKEISFGLSDSKQPIRNGFEWDQAWCRASKAIGFLFPHRVNELAAYGEYIHDQFAAKSQQTAGKIVLYDKAIRNIVQGGQQMLLTETHKFTHMYTSLVLPEGAEYSKYQLSSGSDRQIQQPNRAIGNGARVEICNRFNNPPGCSYSDAECRYRHICRKCRRGGHSYINCHAEKK